MSPLKRQRTTIPWTNSWISFWKNFQRESSTNSRTESCKNSCKGSPWQTPGPGNHESPRALSDEATRLILVPMKMRLRGRDPFEKRSSPPNPHSPKLLKIGLICVADAP